MIGCGTPPPADGPGDAEPPAAEAEAPLPDSVPLVVLQQEGGIAGATSELTVYRTGEATLAQDPAPGGIAVRRWTIEPADFDAITALLGSAGFRALEPEYLPGDTCCDRITYTITVPGATGDRTIRTMDAAQQPDALTSLIERLRALETTAPQ
jgi:hypothetical protein